MNHERKKKFLKEMPKCDRTKTSYKNIFELIEKYEDTIQTDLADMNEEQIWGMIKNINYNIRSLKEATRDYRLFCKEQRLEVKELPTNIFNNPVLAIGNNSYVKDENHLNELLYELFGEDSGYDESIKGYLWMAWIGVPLSNDIVNVMDSDVNLQRRTIVVGGKTYHYPACADDVFEHLINDKTYYITRNINGRAKVVAVKRTPGHRLVRAARDIKNVNSLQSRLSRRMGELDPDSAMWGKLKYSSVADSGEYLRAMQSFDLMFYAEMDSVNKVRFRQWLNTFYPNAEYTKRVRRSGFWSKVE